ncbi:hypothetical protein K1719_029377 [Acacia pycnantha]|nr:hypothetical protein K1719_029377 [Acacia pycnantha]
MGLCVKLIKNNKYDRNKTLRLRAQIFLLLLYGSPSLPPIIFGFLLRYLPDMGGGNGQKAKMAREKNMEKNKASKGSQLDSNKKAMTIQCKVCMQTFICTTSEVKCKEHAEAKHPKSDLCVCFPHLKKLPGK